MIQIATLDELIQTYCLMNLKGHKRVHNKYKKLYESAIRIVIEDEDIPYLEDYLLIGIKREVIANLFGISAKTLRRFIKKEEAKTAEDNRFKRDIRIDTGKKLIIKKTIYYYNDPFKSEIHYIAEDITYDNYNDDLKTSYYQKKKITIRAIKKKII